MREVKSSWGIAGRESWEGWDGSGKATWVGTTSITSSMVVLADVAADVAAVMRALVLFFVVLPMFDQL